LFAYTRTMKRCLVMKVVPALVVLMMLGLATAVADSAEKPKASASTSRSTVTDEDAIRASSRAFETAFNKGDVKAIAALWTEDGDYHDEEGAIFKGREAIAGAYREFFEANPDSRLRIVIDSLKLVNDSAAIEDGRAIATTASGAPAISKYSVVHVKAGGKWLMSTVRDTRVETPSTYAQLEDFEWLIGNWVAEENGSKTTYECRWVANKSFIERKYVVTHADQSVSGGLQIIGWNAQEGCVQSWNFASDGGHSIGKWQPHDKGWAAEVSGMTGQGVSTSAYNVFTKLDDNACTWQSQRRRVGDQDLPDTDEVVIKRQAK
jgi:uncharacterized protein (TIGR02246 family)